jgi:hypothetical protein
MPLILPLARSIAPHGRLVQDDAFALDVHERVGRAEIHRDHRSRRKDAKFTDGSFIEWAVSRMARSVSDDNRFVGVGEAVRSTTRLLRTVPARLPTPPPCSRIRHAAPARFSAARQPR